MTLGLSLKNVSKVWNPEGPDPVPAVLNLSLEVENGEFVVLLGPSGCGKSSLLYVVAGLEGTTQGSVTFDGLEITTPSPERSLIFQEASLYPWLTVQDNITFGLKIAGATETKMAKAADRLLRLVGLVGAGDKRPHELSGGMRQRAALARALAMEPKVLLMDEPFAALDEITRQKLNDDLLSLKAKTGATVIFVTHSVFESVFLSDRIMVMAARPGRIIKEIKIDAPYPRGIDWRTSPEYAAVARETSDTLMSTLAPGEVH